MASKDSKNVTEQTDWKGVARLMLISRAMDDKEENELVPDKKVLYQFSARGHEMAQILLGKQLTHPHDAASAYYRSRPLMLAAGLTPGDAMAAPMGKSGGYSDGRDIGVVCNLPGTEGPTVLPMAGDVGSQYTPAVGWAQGIEYHRTVLKNKDYEGAISVVLGGDGSVATNGFWSALTVATTLSLPVLFFIEDNGYGISVNSRYQTPGGNIANNLRAFKNLRIFDGSGTDPEDALGKITQSVSYVRQRKGPALIRMTVPRLNGHSYQDNQAYKTEEMISLEQKNDPLIQLKNFAVPGSISKKGWQELESDVRKEVDETAEIAWNRDDPDPEKVTRFLTSGNPGGEDHIPMIGGLRASGIELPDGVEQADPETQRINIVEAVRRTLDVELELNDRLLVFGEDVGAKGGVHAATMGLQTKHGEERVFDTSLSEEGIVGRAVGLAYSGLMPVAEIQFRKYADPATEQLKNCGTIRWRTANKFAAPVVVRMPGGFAKCGDPWHSESNEVFFSRMIGWNVAYPSTAEDAVGLLRSAMRGNNPVIFFEHRNLLDAKSARNPYPGDRFMIPFGKAKKLREGSALSVVTWGAMCERCIQAAGRLNLDAEIIDLRTLSPWDREMVFDSVKKTNRCLIVHEDTKTAGFGAEISAEVSGKLFQYLDAPVQRLTMPDVPMPYNKGLMDAVLPDVDAIAEAMEKSTTF